ncbi:MAG TPA: YIP1 family protein [Myxococcota bacterium]|jgi:hypothetical protein|nr:YIP1 family protein [Myxococcota bacterium]
MDLAAAARRALDLALSPARTWEKIAQEPGTAPAVCMPHLAVMGLFSAATLALFAVILRLRLGPGMGVLLGPLLGVVPSTLLLLGGAVWVLAQLARWLAPSMESTADAAAALKLAVFGTTPTYLATALFALDALFVTGAGHRLAVAAGAAWTFWLLHHGVGVLTATPAAQRTAYAGALAFAWLVLSAFAVMGPRFVL